MRVGVLLVLLFGSVCLATAEEPAPKLTKPMPEQLIELLGSSDFRAREAASRDLAKLGTTALPALRKAQDHSDPEIRRRLEELIPMLEAAVALEPRRVTLQLENKPIKDVFAEVTKQTGYKLALTNENGNRDKLVHSFKFENLAFWDAMQRICETSGLALQQNYYGDDILRLQAGEQDQSSPYVHLNGAFRLVAQGFNYGRSVQFGLSNRTQMPLTQRGSEYLSFNMNISVEPRLPLLSVGQVRLTQADDEYGTSFLPPATTTNGSIAAQRFYYGNGYRSFNHHAQANLVWAGKNSHTIKLLRGAVPVTILTEQKPMIVVENVLASKGKKFESDGTQLDLDDISEAAKGVAVGNGKTYQLKISLRDTRPDNPNDYTWVHTLAQRLELFDAKGVKFAARGYNWSETTPTSVKGATFTFAGDTVNGQQVGPPSKLVFYAWIKRDHEVTFEFRDLPLP